MIDPSTLTGDCKVTTILVLGNGNHVVMDTAVLRRMIDCAAVTLLPIQKHNIETLRDKAVAEAIKQMREKDPALR